MFAVLLLASVPASSRPPPPCDAHGLSTDGVMKQLVAWSGWKPVAQWTVGAAHLNPCAVNTTEARLQVELTRPATKNDALRYRVRVELVLDRKTGAPGKASRKRLARIQHHLSVLLKQASRTQIVKLWRAAYSDDTGWYEDQEGTGPPCLAYRASTRVMDDKKRALGSHELRYCRPGGAMDYTVEAGFDAKEVRSLEAALPGPLALARLIKAQPRGPWNASGTVLVDGKRIRFLAKHAGKKGWLIDLR